MGQIAAVILAAGMGTRMRSDKAKVLHEIRGVPMLAYVLRTAAAVAVDGLVVVVGNQAEAVKRAAAGQPGLIFAHQEQRLGTGHAVMCALPHLPARTNHVVILCGDVPLLRPDTLKGLVSDHRRSGRDLTLLSVLLERPYGYGRVITDAKGDVLGIVEEADASPEQRMNRRVNAGTYCIEKEFLFDALPKLRSDNAQGELYLTDLVAIGRQSGAAVGALDVSDPREVIGVNTPEELRAVESILAAAPGWHAKGDQGLTGRDQGFCARWENGLKS